MVYENYFLLHVKPSLLVSVHTYEVFSWQDDDADTYEPPPCERPAMKVPQRPVEENVYLGNFTALGLYSKRQHRHSNAFLPPEILSLLFFW